MKLPQSSFRTLACNLNHEDFKLSPPVFFIEIVLEQRGRRGRQRLDCTANRVQRQSHRRCARSHQGSAQKRGEHSSGTRAGFVYRFNITYGIVGIAYNLFLRRGFNSATISSFHDCVATAYFHHIPLLQSLRQASEPLGICTASGLYGNENRYFAIINK